MIAQAVFLVGGKGTRLGALTRATPKPLLEIAPGLRFLDVLIEEAARHAFTDILLVAGYRGEQVEALYQGRSIRGAKVRVLREAEPAGTAGALRLAAPLLDRRFLVANGDTLFDFNLRALTALPEGASLGRLALRRVPDATRFGSVDSQGGRITGFQEKRRGGDGPGLINGGVYCFSRAVLDRLPEKGSLEADVFPALARDGLLTGSEQQGYFLDIGLPETFAQACRDVPARRVRPAAFLALDGMLRAGPGLPAESNGFAWTRGAKDAVLRLNEAGYFVLVIDGGTGIASRFRADRDIAPLHAQVQEQLAEVGAHVDAFYPQAPRSAPVDEERGTMSRQDRAPAAGTILRAMAEWPVRPDGSFLISGLEADVQDAARAGLAAHLHRNEPFCSLVEAALGATAAEVPAPAAARSSWPE